MARAHLSPPPYIKVVALTMPRNHSVASTCSSLAMAPQTQADKNAEFAKLFDLFEMLATRRSRRAVPSDVADDARVIQVPAELEPVFRNLSNVVPPRGRPRRNTVAALGRTVIPEYDSEDEEGDVESVAKFPLGKTYTFTFKMMIHKLYQVDEWAAKVRDVLKQSKLEYKPLAEVEPRVKHASPAKVTSDNRIHFKLDPPTRDKKIHNSARRNSLASSSRPPSYSAKLSGAVGADGPATKKRCIARRKSLSGPLSPTAMGDPGWIYDARVSAATSGGVRETTTTKAEPRPRPRYQSLQTGEKKTGPGSHRVVSAAVEKEENMRTATKRRYAE
ncbi:unnamed protein product [Mycena citricolor]|uniref:Uncharacterized protein n=1 Tax=Mycena citricolor TaxID=2018698 RepID=A0AAD2K1S1_9AGAR|nr:unnamed protein product [Mycena citricolor]